VENEEGLVDTRIAFTTSQSEIIVLDGTLNKIKHFKSPHNDS